jgi:hypothetical protein
MSATREATGRTGEQFPDRCLQPTIQLAKFAQTIDPHGVLGGGLAGVASEKPADTYLMGSAKPLFHPGKCNNVAESGREPQGSAARARALTR